MQKDIRLLFITRITRMFAYGFLSVSLALYLSRLGLSAQQIGFVFTFTLVGDAVISLWLTTNADRRGRKKMLIIGSALMLMAGVVFAITREPALLALAATIGVISPSGKEIGPFLSIEQASLSQLIPNEKRTSTFAWYNLSGSMALALGALSGGLVVQALLEMGVEVVNADRVLVVVYAAFGLLLMALYTRITPQAEAPSTNVKMDALGLGKSRGIVLKLSALFALDAFAGAFVIDSFIAYWLSQKFNVEPAVLGSIFFGTNLLAGFSALLASRMAEKFGLINTMVFTHIPSNILLILVPLMPNLPLAIGMLFLRFSISQMDVPTRQSYTMAVVSPEERSATSGVTTIARSVGSAIAPSIAGPLLATSWPFFISGGLKIVYDLLLWHNMRAVKPPEEMKKG
ncbi:MAG TPA: MFS transporter [Thermoflexales bacterium]|nr:MFS transporter [Thermoflexales bacterium]HQW34198.1 MFS transporter [Thermoflexales bacterium]HQX76212.1 MFS transporter [Thermoflexales bacterium]